MFTITILPINDDPTLNPINDVTLFEDPDANNDNINDIQTVALTGITPRPANEMEDLDITSLIHDTTFVVFAKGGNVIGETLTVDDGTGPVAFEFVNSLTTAPTGTQIGILPTDRTQVVAQKAAAAINAVFAGLSTATDNSVAIRVPSADVSFTTNDSTDSMEIFDQNDLFASTNIVYLSRDTAGTFQFTPARHHFGGPVNVTITVTDAGIDGIAGNADDQFTEQTFAITVRPVNDNPTIDPIQNLTVNEDDPQTTVTLTGITAGPTTTGPNNELEDVRLIPTLNSSTTVAIAIGANVVGETLQIGAQTFTYVDAAIVTAPTANQIPVNTTVATSTAMATQLVAQATATVVNALMGANTVSAFQNTINTALPVVASSTEAFALMSASSIITAPQISYISRNLAQTADLTFTPIGDAFGEVSISVVTEDAGLDGIFDDDPTTLAYNEAADNNRVTRTFTVRVNPINDLPTMDQIDAQETLEASLEQSVALTGITAGPINELEDIRLSYTLEQTTTVVVAVGAKVIGQTVNIGGTDFTYVDASLVLVPSPTQIAVSTLDSSFNVASATAAVVNNMFGPGSVIPWKNTVNTPLAVTLPPATGVAATTYFYALDETEIVRDLAIDYVSRDSTGTFRYTPFNDDNFGVVTVTITTEDAGVDGVFDDDPTTLADESADNLSIDRVFTITVDPVNDVPTTDPITDQLQVEDLDTDLNGLNDEISITLTGIHPQPGITGAPGNELEDLQVSATLVDTTIVAFAAGNNIIGQTLTVNSVPFMFVDSATTVPTGNQIAVSRSATTQQVAAAAGVAINSVFPGMAIVTDNTVALTINRSLVSGSDERDAFAIRDQSDLIESFAIDYNSRDTTATFRYIAGKHQFGGPVTVIVTTTDAGVDGLFVDDPATLADEAADNLTTTQTFTITVTPTNDQPLMDAVSPQSTLEDSGPQTVALSGIYAGPSRTAAPYTGEDGNELEDIALTHTLHNTTSIAFSIGQHMVGETLTINGTAFTYVNAGIVTTPTATQIAVNLTDDTLTVATKTATRVNAQLGAGTVVATYNNITTAGTVAVSSGRFAVMTAAQIVQDLSIDYVSRDTTGVFHYTPTVDAFGQVTVTVTVADAGVDGIFGNADDLSIDRTFTITVIPDNDAPTTDPISAQNVLEEGPEQSVPITGITPRPGNELEDISITPTLHDTTTIAFAVGQNLIGESLTLNGTVFTFVNAATTPSPTSTQIAVNAADPTQTVAIKAAAAINSHFAAVVAEASHNTITVDTAMAPAVSNSDRFALMRADQIITNLAVDYVSRATTGTFRYTPIADAFGLVRVTLRTLDAGVDGIFGNGDDLWVDTTFSITVIPDNDYPTMDVIPDQTANEEGAQETVALTGITPRPFNELEDISITHTLHNTVSIAVSRGDHMIGETITIGGVTYTYVDGASTPVPSNTQIAVLRTDATQTVAAKTATTINNRAGAGTVSATNNTVTADVSLNPTVSSATRFAIMPAASIVGSLQVVYNSRDNTGSFLYTPDTENFGQVTVTIHTLDAGVDGIFGNADDLFIDRTFRITVNPVNDQPTLDPIADTTVNEETSEQSVALTGITPRPGNELEDISVTYRLHDTTSVAFAAGSNLPGEWIDIGATRFTFVDSAVVASPTATQISVSAGDSTQQVATTAANVINALLGAGTVTATDNYITTLPGTAVTVSSANRMAVMTADQIVQNLAVDYVSRATTGTFRYTPVADAFGTVTVTINVLDAGVDGIFNNADDLFVEQTFSIRVTPDNDQPTMTAIAPQTVGEDSPEQSVALTGITPRPGNELEDISITPTLLDTTSIAIAVGANVIGESITVGGQQFTFVNAATTPTPTATQIAVLSTDTTQTVATKTAAAINAAQGANSALATDNTITVATGAGVTVSSTNRFAVMHASQIVSNIAVDYNSRDTTGTLRYTPVADAFGHVVIRLQTLDAGVDGLFGTADDLSITRDVLITVTPSNDDPTLDAVAPQTVAEDSGAHSVALTGITPRPGNELEDIRLTETLHSTNTVAIAIGANVVGETLTVGGTVFTYVDAAVVTSPTATQIAVNVTDSTFGVANKTAAAINAVLGANTAVASNNTVNTALAVVASSTNRFAVYSASSIINGLGFTYNSRDTSGTLNFSTVGDAFGRVVVTVTATDAGVDGIFGNADDRSTSQDVVITVTPANDAPTIAQVNPQTTAEDSPEQSVSVGGITVGPTNELEDLRLTATLNNTTTLVIAAGANVIGDSITVNGTVFTYVNAATNPTPTASQIAVLATDSTQSVATATAAAVNAAIGSGSVVASDNTISSYLTLSASSAENFVIVPAANVISGLAVDYNSRDANATVRYTPVADAFGLNFITLTATDAGVDGLFGTADDLSTSTTFAVTVTPVNDSPTLSVIDDQTVEDSSEQSVPLTGISTGRANELEDIRLSYVLHNSTSVAVAQNVIGETLTVDGTVFTYVDAAVVTSPSTAQIAINTTDTTQAIAAKTATVVNARLGAGSVIASANTVTSELSIAGSSTAKFHATTSAGLLSNLAIDYNSRDTDGAFRFTPIGNSYGLATVTITAQDAGVDGIFDTADDLSASRTFLIEVLPVNDPPTINAVPAQSTNEDSGLQTVALSGITPGPGELEAVRITASIDNTSVVIVPSGGDAVGKTITVNGVDFTFVTTPTGDNREIVIIDVVTLVTVDSTFEVADAMAQTLNAYFGAGSAVASGNTVSTALPVTNPPAPFLVVPAASIIQQPVVNYTTGSNVGTLTYVPLPNAFGNVTVTLALQDAGTDGIFDTADDQTTTRKVSIYVRPVNDLPTAGTLSDVHLEVSAPQQTITLNGITRGPLNELENIRVTVTSSDPDFLPTPVVTYVSPQNIATLTFTTKPGVSGASTITVTIEDAGVDGVFEDPVTPQLEQADNLKVVRTFRVTAAPMVLTPSGTITDDTPLLTWTGVPGTSAYEVELVNLTEGTRVALPNNNLTVNTSLQVTTALPLGKYRLRVRSFDATNTPGLWSEPSDFTVGIAPTVLAPSSNRIPDSTPTFSWSPVNGADSYELTIVDDLTNTVLVSVTGLDGHDLHRAERTGSAAGLPIHHHRGQQPAGDGSAVDSD
ncbi:MAG: hypothetical protein R3C49_13965 [Planctomycetaceae bacterium]